MTRAPAERKYQDGMVRGICRRAWVALLAILLPACVAHDLSPVEAERLARWHPIDLINVELNLPILISQRITESERRLTHEAVVEDRLRIGINEGRIETVFAREASFSDEFDKNLHSAEFFSARMIEAFDRRYDGHREFREIHHKTHKSAGFAAVVNVKDQHKRCFFAIVGYRMKGGAYYVGDFGNLDTAVTMLYCDPALEFADLAAALQSVELVADRNTFAEALRKKIHAAPGGFRGGGLET